MPGRQRQPVTESELTYEAEPQKADSRRSHCAELLGGRASPQSAATPKPSPSEFPKVEGLTREVAEFILHTGYRDLPGDVVELGRKSILDGLGLALCGSVAETGQLSRDYVKSLGLAGRRRTILGSPMKAPPRFAAFVNGIGIHADDYDDTQLAVAEDRVYGLLTHPTAPALSAALALAEARSLSGRELMAAYHVGVEVECKIAEAIAPRHYDEGFHSTGTCGAIGAAAAAAKANRPGSPPDSPRPGNCRQRGCRFAREFRHHDQTPPRRPRGRVRNRGCRTGGAGVDRRRADSGSAPRLLPRRRRRLRPRRHRAQTGPARGPSASPASPSSPILRDRSRIPAMTEMARLIRTHGIQAQQVERVDVGTNRNMPNALIHHRPKTGLEAKFSMEFCMAALLLYGKAGLTEFTGQVVNRPEVQAMIARIHFGVNPVAEAAGYNKMTTILDIRLRDGRTISGRADFAKGSPAIPMTYQEVADKFLDCAAFARWSREKANRVVETVGKLETVSDIRTLTALLAG